MNKPRQLLNRIFGNRAPEGVDQRFWEASDLDDFRDSLPNHYRMPSGVPAKKGLICVCGAQSCGVGPFESVAM